MRKLHHCRGILASFVLLSVPVLALFVFGTGLSATPQAEVEMSPVVLVVDNQTGSEVVSLKNWSYTGQKPHHCSPSETCRAGNNGVGNGEDPQPPGNPRINDGPGTGPGNPGNKGGIN